MQDNSFNELFTGLFRENNNAGKAYNAALKLGYTKDEINVLMTKETKQKHSHKRKHSEVSIEDEAIQGAGVGGSLGVTSGAFIGALTALGTFILISSIGTIAAGSIAIWLAGALAGGIAGGLVGVFINIGIALNHAKYFNKELKQGAILIMLIPHSENDRKNLEIEWNKYDSIIFATR